MTEPPKKWRLFSKGWSRYLQNIFSTFFCIKMIIHKYIWCLGIDPYHTVPFTISFVHIYLRSHMYDSVRTYMNDIYLWQIKHGNVCKNCVWTYISARLYSELHLNFAKEVKTILYVRYRYVIVYALYNIHICQTMFCMSIWM